MTSKELTKWKEKHGLNQVELARLLGVSKMCISRWESGKRKIPAFLHITLKCLKVKKGGDKKPKGKKSKRKEVKKKNGNSLQKR